MSQQMMIDTLSEHFGDEESAVARRLHTQKMEAAESTNAVRREKDSKRVRIRPCPGMLKVPSTQAGGTETTFKCQLEAQHRGSHLVQGFLILQNGTTYDYSMSWANIGKREVRESSVRKPSKSRS